MNFDIENTALYCAVKLLRLCQFAHLAIFLRAVSPPICDIYTSTLSAVKSNVFFEKFKVKSNGKKSEVQRVLDFTFF